MSCLQYNVLTAHKPMPLPGADIVAGGFGGVRREMLYAMSPRSNTSALRVGDWKIIEGVMGRGDCEPATPFQTVVMVVGPAETIAQSPGARPFALSTAVLNPKLIPFSTD